VGQLDACHSVAVLRLSCVQTRDDGGQGGSAGCIHTRIVSCDASGGWISWGFAFLAAPSPSPDVGVRLGEKARG
jgi:hypothetical protein